MYDINPTNGKRKKKSTDDTDTAVQGTGTVPGYRHIHAFCAKKYITFNSLILFIFVIDSTLEILFATTSVQRITTPSKLPTSLSFH